jgi:two-component system nitrate/nitrite response regulator NarL
VQAHINKIREVATPMTRRTRIVIVEDHQLLAETVGLALQAEGHEVVLADLADTDSLLTSVAADPDTLVLLDLDLGPLGDGTELIPGFVAAGATVLVVTGVRDRARLATTLEAGAVGFRAKDAPFDELLETITRVAEGESVIDPNDRYQLLADLREHRSAARRQQAPFESLTNRERQVLVALGEGKSVETIASEWVVSTATVRTQVRGILTKLDVNSQLAAVAKARAAGVLSDS